MTYTKESDTMNTINYELWITTFNKDGSIAIPAELEATTTDRAWVVEQATSWEKREPGDVHTFRASIREFPVASAA
jgi:hypothetical protein